MDSEVQQGQAKVYCIAQGTWHSPSSCKTGRFSRFLCSYPI